MNIRTRLAPVATNFLLFAVLSATCGCASLDFGYREQAENAFRRQNQLSTNFMLVAEELASAAPEVYEELLIEEDLMLVACRPLNTLASKRRNNEPADFGDRKAVMHSIAGCEQAAADFDAVLQQAQRSIAKR